MAVVHELPSPKSNCSGSTAVPTEELVANAVCFGTRARPRAATRHGKRFSSVNLDARTGLTHHAWRTSCSARHSVERDISSELCRRSTLKVCRGVSVTAVSISARTSLVRRRFSGQDWSGAPRRSFLSFVLMLSSDQSGSIARISRVFGPPRAAGTAVQRLALPNATTHDAKVQRKIKNCLNNDHHLDGQLTCK